MTPTRLAGFLVLLPLLWASRPAAGAEHPAPDTSFVAACRPDVERLRSEGLSDTGALPSWRAVRLLYDLREEQLILLTGVHGLHTLTGAATQDALDVDYVRAMHEIAEASVQADSIAPTEAEAVLLAQVMEDTPNLGEKPAGFMSLGFIGLTIVATDSLQHAGVVTPPAAARLGLRLVSYATGLHLKAYSDPLAALGQNDFLTGAFLSRLRCPRDGSVYNTSGVKTRLSDHRIFRVYDLVCPVEGTQFQVEFYQEMASRLYQMAPRQKTNPGAEKPASGGPDP